MGYQWIHVDRMTGQTNASNWGQNKRLQIAGFASLCIAVTLLHDAINAPVNVGGWQPAAAVATKAYLLDNDIVVELESGCLGILKNSDNKQIGKPILSSDGSEVAFTLSENKQCKLVTIELSDGRRSDFGTCPTSMI